MFPTHITYVERSKLNSQQSLFWQYTWHHATHPIGGQCFCTSQNFLDRDKKKKFASYNLRYRARSMLTGLDAGKQIL